MPRRSSAFARRTVGKDTGLALRNGSIDGTVKTGSLQHVRNLYRSLAHDGEWFDFSVVVRGKNIGVKVNGVDVVHLKGDLTKEMAHAMSMNYGINYGVAPNAGEGGVGRMLADDAEVYAYHDEISGEPFLFGVQGEGRRWTQTFSQEALGIFEYLFTDAMTIIDHKGRLSRIYRSEEVFFDGISTQAYMDHLVDQTVLILTNEPADIYANPTFLPDALQGNYDRLWTPERVNRVLDVLEKYHIALEINPRYRIPSFDIIRRARERGIKFTFGTNNVDSRFGRLEYTLEAVEACGLTPGDIWFPSMSIRSSRPVVIYNHFDLPSDVSLEMFFKHCGQPYFVWPIYHYL